MAETRLEHPFLARLVEPERASRPALCSGAQNLTYADLVALVAALAEALDFLGVGPGQRVLVRLPDSPEHVIAMLALLSLGATAVPQHPAGGRQRLALAAEEVRPFLCLLPPGEEPPPGLNGHSLEFDFFAGLSLDGHPLEIGGRTLPVPAWEEQAVAMIRFSSGSTGRPKGALLSHGQLLWSARTLSEVFGLGSTHRELLLASMAYSGAWQRLVATFHAGGCAILFQGPPAVPAILEEIRQRQAEGFYTPPPLVRMLLRDDPERVRKAMAGCRTLEIGSAPLNAAELEQLLALLPGARIFVHYGMTECSRAVILNARAHPERLHTVGRPAPGVEVRVVDARGRDLPAGRAGEIFVRGPQLALGYLNGIGGQAFRDGWLASGDHGMLDEAGFLTFLGRADDRINCGGHSFFPAEAEAELGPVAGVRALLVAGVPDPRGVLEQVPWAFVVPDGVREWSPASLLKQARSRLPAHMVPRGVTLLEELPLTASGKPDRRGVLEHYGK